MATKKPPKENVRGYPPAERERHCLDLMEWIGEGKTMRAFCRQEGRPSYGAFYDWIEQDKTLASLVARARDMGADAIGEECMEIADDASNDLMVDKDGGIVIDKEHIQRSKLRIETRLKLLACWNPKKYGAKQIISGDQENPLKTETSFGVFDELLKAMALERHNKAKGE